MHDCRAEGNHLGVAAFSTGHEVRPPRGCAYFCLVFAAGTLYDDFQGGTGKRGGVLLQGEVSKLYLCTSSFIPLWFLRIDDRID